MMRIGSTNKSDPDQSVWTLFKESFPDTLLLMFDPKKFYERQKAQDRALAKVLTESAADIANDFVDEAYRASNGNLDALTEEEAFRLFNDAIERAKNAHDNND